MQHILIVDDKAINLYYAEEVLKPYYKLAMAKSGQIALNFLSHTTPDLILLDINMPDMNGYVVYEKIRADEKNREVPIIFLTAATDRESEIRGFHLGAADYIKKPFEPEAMLSRIRKVLEYDALRHRLQDELEKKTQEIERITLQSFITVANTIDAKDPYTKNHSRHTAYYAECLARKLGWERQDITNLYYIALLHDIGKMGIPDHLLNKAGRLTDEEYEVVKQHVQIGEDILKDITLLHNASAIVLYHHEHFDGSGYPSGLKGAEIPLSARIIALADSYDAMLSDRSFRNSMPINHIKMELLRCSGKQFDPYLVQLLLELIDEGMVYPEEQDTSDGQGARNLAQEGNILLQKIVLEYTEEIKNGAQKDALTGLWNRSYTENHINNFLRRKNCAGALFMLDLDNFKAINDSFGHQEGDQLLIDFAKTIRECVRKEDVICRLGGDEFMIFLKDIQARDKIGEKAELMLRNFRKYLSGPENYGSVSLSIGIAIAPEDGADFSALYQSADKALYFVKQNGKDFYHFFREERYYIGEKKRQDIQVDLAYLKEAFEEKQEINGAYQVSYDGFKRIYQFLQRILLRTKRSVQIVLFTLVDEQGDAPSQELLSTAIDDLGRAIATSLRCGDVATSYSDSQYLVILLDASQNDGRIVAERVLQRYLHMTSVPQVVLQFDLEEIEKQHKYMASIYDSN